jgi:hypothetical protein
MKKLLISLLISFVILNAILSQENNNVQYEISLQAINCLKTNDIQCFKTLMDSTVANSISEKDFNDFLLQSFEVINKYKMPKKESMMIETRYPDYEGEKIKTIGLIFAFSKGKKSPLNADYHIVIVFSEDLGNGKIIGFRIRDFKSYR